MDYWLKLLGAWSSSVSSTVVDWDKQGDLHLRWRNPALLSEHCCMHVADGRGYLVSPA